MSIKDELENICGIEKEFITKLFDNFFDSRGIDIKNHINFSSSEYYNNCEIIKIEIKDGKTYEDFINEALEKITNYYLDGDNVIEGLTREKSIEFVLEQLNKYTPIDGISFSELRLLRNIDANGSIIEKGDDFIEYLKGLENKKLRKKASQNICFQRINVPELDSDEKYLLSNGSIQSSRQVLGHLHGDIGEFILFILVEGFLKSPLLFSKISHCKSSPQDKIKGSDGIHIEVDDEGNYIYNFLESKINKDFPSSLDQIIESNKEFLDNSGEGDVNNEVTILFNNKNNIDKKYQFLFKGNYNSHIIPYLDERVEQENLPYNLACLLSYHCEEYKNVKDRSADIKSYIDSYTLKRIDSLLKKYHGLADKLNGKKVRIFLLPLIDEVELIKIFLNKIKKN